MLSSLNVRTLSRRLPMALTTVKCPECGEITRTTKAVSAGAKLRCPRCKAVFPFHPSANDALNNLPVFEPAEPGSLRELLASGNRMTSHVASDNASGRYRGITNEPFNPDQEITVDRMALKSERLKGRLRGGKPRRFDGPRQFVAVVGILALMGLGYEFFWWFHGWYYDLSNAQRMRQESLARQFQNPQEPSITKPASPKLKTPDVNPMPALTDANLEPTPKTARTVARTPVRIGDLEIEITRARISRIRMKNGANRNSYLTLSVRVHNRSQQSLEYKGWHCAGTMLTLRDARSKNTYSSIRFFPMDLPQDCIPQSVIPTGKSIQDMLVFKPPASPYPSLELDLPSPIGYDTYRFSIPADLIEIVEEEPVPIADAPPRPVAKVRLTLKPPATRQEQILADYYERWSEVEQIARGKSSSRAGEFKRKEKVKILDELSKKHEIPLQDVRVIVPK
jgi:hypothetical protein